MAWGIAQLGSVAGPVSMAAFAVITLYSSLLLADCYRTENGTTPFILVHMICGCGLVKAFQKAYYVRYGGGANVLADGYSKGTGLGAEIIGTFVLVYTVFSATDPKRSARDSHVPILAPLLIGFAVFMVHLATIPITGTGINPARSLGAAVIYGKQKAWDDEEQPKHWDPLGAMPECGTVSQIHGGSVNTKEALIGGWSRGSLYLLFDGTFVFTVPNLPMWFPLSPFCISLSVVNLSFLWLCTFWSVGCVPLVNNKWSPVIYVRSALSR